MTPTPPRPAPVPSEPSDPATSASGPSAAPAASIDEVLALFTDWADDPYDEELSQLAHALQTAALALEADAPDSLVVAALLHDVGHLLTLAAGTPAPPTPGAVSRPVIEEDDHETVGARYLTGLFPPAVTGPIALHVRAKRYLCATEPGYEAALSSGSAASLARQGGRLDEAEVATFARNPGAADAVALRRWDDRGKVEGLTVPALDTYRDRLARVTTGSPPPP